MAISKPSWLRNALDHLNWDILTWKVYVGDAVESAIDWAIGWINEAIEWGEDAWNKAVDAWNKAVDIGKELLKTINREVDKLLNKIDAWWDDLGEWWSTKVTLVKGWIDATGDYLKDWWETELQELKDIVDLTKDYLIEWWNTEVQELKEIAIAVTNFFTVTLPGLASRLDVKRAFDDFRLEWKGLLNFWENFSKEVAAFFTDPLEWLWTRFTDWFLGPER